MYITTKLEDEQFGFEMEDKLLKLLKSKYKNSTIIKLPRFHKYDFFIKHNNKSYFYELKSRRINSNTYDTTYIGLNKKPNSENINKIHVIFVFGFKDGLYYIDYNKNMNYINNNKTICKRKNGEIRSVFQIEIDKLKSF